MRDVSSCKVDPAPKFPAAKPTVMGGQQVCNQACRPCNDGDVTVTTQTQERATDVGPVKNKEKKRERERVRERGEGRIKR